LEAVVELVYAGAHPRTYLFPGHPPVEAEPDGTYEVPYDPEDGCWQAPAAEDASKPGKRAKTAPDTTKEA
jgi:hypothetical protein